MRRVLVIVALGCAWALGSAWPTGIATATERPGTLLLAQAEDAKPLAQILKTIAERFPGRALDAELVKQAEPVYRVKWLGEDGKVREVTSDAETGKILDVR